jgi:hypothetical protein
VDESARVSQSHETRTIVEPVIDRDTWRKPKDLEKRASKKSKGRPRDIPEV